MGALTVDSWRRLNDLVASHGADDVLHMICDQIVEVGELSIIGEREAINGRVLWKWLNDPRHPERIAEYKEALAFKGEIGMHQAQRIVDSATPEDVGVKKLQSDFRVKAASKWNKQMYGEEREKGGGGVTVVVNRGGSDSVHVEGNILTIDG